MITISYLRTSKLSSVSTFISKPKSCFGIRFYAKANLNESAPIVTLDDINFLDYTPAQIEQVIEFIYDC